MKHRRHPEIRSALTAAPITKYNPRTGQADTIGHVLIELCHIGCGTPGICVLHVLAVHPVVK